MITHSITPRIKVIAMLALAVMAVVFVLQNTHAVDTRLLFVTVNMPIAALLGMTLLIGFTVGVLAALKAGRPRAKPPDRAPDCAPDPGA
jgi:uncharacterized integral membrane protein